MLRGEWRAPVVQVFLHCARNLRSVISEVRPLQGRNGGGELVAFRSGVLQFVKERLKVTRDGDGLGEVADPLLDGSKRGSASQWAC
jgi:hypothetical protein